MRQMLKPELNEAVITYGEYKRPSVFPSHLTQLKMPQSQVTPAV
jgi:hypothetical protein